MSASGARAEIADVLSLREPPEGTAWLLIAVALVLVGLVSLALALAVRMFPGRAEELQGSEAYSLALIAVGLSVGCTVWRRRQRDALASAVKAQSLNLLHAVMSQTNRLILRRPNPIELLEGVCEVCVKAGNMDLAVVDMFDVREVHRASSRVVATSPQLLLDGARLQTLMTTLVAHKGLCVVVDDAAKDERLRESNSWCLAHGLSSLAAVPLRRGGALVGILFLCSRTRSFFGGKVTPLLSELGADISFALDNADRERERQSAVLADRARLAAEDANRAKTEFLGQMSHELRTPLNAMLGFAQLLATDKEQVLSATQAERVRLITHAGWHLLGLVNDVMDISRIESRRFEVTNVCSDISGVLDEALALTQSLARANKVELSEQAPSRFGIGAVVDPRRLLQVLINLLSNACKYNRPGGQVRVDVTHAGAEVFLDVVDDGVGMTAEQLSHLFEPFNRLGNEGHAIEGSGIGLSLARSLVELMKGRLDIESSPASGTRARLVLPSCAIPLKRALDDPGAQAKVERDAKVILYIEDDPVNRILVEQMLLRCEGVRLLQAETGEDGIAMARQNTPDLVLLDMHLPDMSGFQVLDALRSDARTKALPVVAVSANAMEVDVARAFDLGVVAYWTKPLALDAFLAGVASLLGVSAPASKAHADCQL
ncbi:hybrid sensor histidine kinase/response regulator [Roseateles albus]|uniref:histidine kinase n=1 Tax=Roseateles albus TaxID=2987525 RepID=A0ABT5KJM7_9BURK|nr:ATP-binding protein [Roseateles albus]MDC8773041.1 ATP-binding protein [Roseateles albus]